MKKGAVKKRVGRPRKIGFFNGEPKDRWQAAFEYRQTILKKLEYISCSEAMAQLRDDAGKCPFGDWDIKKNQWKLQRMFTELEADNFKEPTKGEHYVMLYEILYGTKDVITREGDVIEVRLDPGEKTMIIREMLKMGGHYAPEKSEGKLTGKLIVEFGKGNLHPFVPDTKNRMGKYN